MDVAWLRCLRSYLPETEYGIADDRVTLSARGAARKQINLSQYYLCFTCFACRFFLKDSCTRPERACREKPFAYRHRANVALVPGKRIELQARPHELKVPNNCHAMRACCQPLSSAKGVKLCSVV
jgi:hypothetical protein